MGTEFPPSVDDMDGSLPAPARVRRAARQIVDATGRRDQAMRDMRAEGATLREIAEAAGLTHTGVRKILARDGDDKPGT
jgi:hypothetical protein